MISIKDYLLAGAIIVLLTGIGISRWELYSVTKEFNEYKESINEQVQKNVAEKARIEKEQNDKYQLAEAGYSGALSVLNQRLRDLQNLPRDNPLQVAGCSSGTVSGEATYTIGTTIRLATRKGTCESSFYADALRTTLQCQRLIEFVK